MVQPGTNGSSTPKNQLPTGFGNLDSVRSAAKSKKIRRLLRKSGFVKRSGHALDKLLESTILAICTGTQGTLAATHRSRDPAINCAASNATFSRAYGYATEDNVRKAMLSLLPGFRMKKNGVWIIDATFLHVHGKKFERAVYGYDSNDDRINMGYHLVNIIDMGARAPVFWKLLPGNTLEVTIFREILAEAMKSCGEKPQIVVFDRGYVSKENLCFLRERGIFWVSQSVEKMKLAARTRSHTPKEWFEYYETGKSCKLYWKGYGGMLIVRDDTIENGKLVDWRVLIGSPELPPERICMLYEKRWGIEEYHKQLRAVGLNELPTGKFAGICLHILLVVLAYLLLHCVEAVVNCIGRSVETIIRAICVAALIAPEES